VVLLGQRVVAGPPAVANDRVHEEALDADEDDCRERENEQVQVEDVLPRVRLRCGRQEAAAQQCDDDEQEAGANRRPRPRSGDRGGHQLVRGSWVLNRRVRTRSGVPTADR
jgi:hypothetical protein